MASHMDEVQLLEPDKTQKRYSQNTRRYAIFLAVVIVVAVGIGLAIYFSQKDTNTSNTWTYSSDEQIRSVEMFQYYLQIRSDQPKPQYYTVRDFLKQIADMYGFEFQVLELVPGYPNVVLTWRSIKDDKSIILHSHSDVVPAVFQDWHYDPFGGYMDEQTGNIYGRGSQDMKPNGIQYIQAVARLKRNGFVPNSTVHILFSCDEETGSVNGVVEILNHKDVWDSFKAQLFLDEGMATNNSRYVIYYTERASLTAKYNFTGNGGHGSLFHNNSANEQMHRVLNKAFDLMHEQLDLMQTQNLTLGQVTVVNPCVILAGVQQNGIYSSNVVPSNAYLQIDIRITPGQAQNISSLAQSWGLEEGAVTFQEFAVEKNVTVLDENNIWWVVFNQTFHDLNLTLDVDIFPAGTSGAFVRNYTNVPVFGFSPMINTVRLLHDNDEYLNNQTFLNGIDLYEKLLTELLKI